MKRRRQYLLALFVTSFLIGALLALFVAYGLSDRADVSPLFQHRPERPPHPIHIYQPPGHR